MTDETGPDNYTIKDLLSIEVAPALGCTEPTAVALCSAAAASLLSAEAESIEIWLDSNLFKNGMAVAIPGAAGSSGMDLAAALGAFGGDPALKLEVLAPIDESVLEKAHRFLQDGRVKVHLDDSKQGIYVKARIAQLRERLATLSAVNMSQIPRDRVGMGSKVTLLDLDSDDEITYELVFPELSDLDKGLISIASPIGRSLVGKQEGDTLKVKIPSGQRRFEVLELLTLHDK